MKLEAEWAWIIDLLLIHLMLIEVTRLNHPTVNPKLLVS